MRTHDTSIVSHRQREGRTRGEILGVPFQDEQEQGVLDAARAARGGDVRGLLTQHMVFFSLLPYSLLFPLHSWPALK